MNTSIASAERFASEIVGQGEPTVVLNIRGARIETLTAFGNTYLREEQLAAALGFHFASTFAHTISQAGLYRGARKKGQVLTECGPLDVMLYSLNGAHQVCLFIQAHRDGEKASRARELLNLLQMLRSPAAVRGDA